MAVLVGATIGKSNYPGQNVTQAIATFDGYVNRPMGTKVIKIYTTEGSWPSTLDADTLDQIATGAPLIVTIKPSRTLSTSEYNNAVAYLQMLISAGAVIDSVVLWQECNGKDSTGTLYFPNAAAYLAYVQYYIGAVRGLGLLAGYDPITGAQSVPATAYYPGDVYVDKIYVDFYGTGYDSAVSQGIDPLGPIAAICDSHVNGPIALGIAEWNASAGGGISPTQWNAYVQYLITYFSNRQAAGKPIGPFCFWMGNKAVGGSGTDQILSSSDYKVPMVQAFYDAFSTTSTPAGKSAPFTPVQVSTNITMSGGSGQLVMWFNQAGGVPSQVGSLLVVRTQTNDGSATVTPPPGWVLIEDNAASGGLPTARVQLWAYLNNPGSLGTLPGMGESFRRRPQTVNIRGRLRSLGQRQITPVQVPTPGTPQIFLISNPTCSFRGTLTEYSTPQGTTQYIDQHGRNSGVTPATSFPMSTTTPSGPVTYTNGLAVTMTGAQYSSAPGGSWGSTPAGWTQERFIASGTNIELLLEQTGLAAGAVSVTPTYTISTSQQAWSGVLGTFYALANTPVNVTGAALPVAVAGTAYSGSLQAVGGATPYAWVESGQLPPGVSMNSSGVFSGTPTTVGTWTFNVTVTDAAFQTATAVKSITVAQAVTVTPAVLPNGATTIAYPAQQMTAIGGTGTYTWSLLSGTMPPGITISSAGVISGTPTAGGIYKFTIEATDGSSNTGTLLLGIYIAVTPTVAAEPVLAYDSLRISRAIELLGNRAVSQLPQCAGASFMLAPGYDLNAPQPTTDIVESMLLNGERPYGRRFSNRTITLPIVIQAPNRALLAAAKETLFDYLNDDTFELVWTRQGGLPLVFDCFRANASAPSYSTKAEKTSTPTAVVQVSFQALPFGRSDTIQTLAFPASILGGPVAPSPVLLDDYLSVSSTTQMSWWSQSSVVATDLYAAYWTWAGTDEDSPAWYTHTISAANITGCTALSFWLGLGTQNYTRWHKGNVSFQITLTDGSSRTITFGAKVRCFASNSTSNPRWNQITIPIPQLSSGFDYTTISAYSVKLWRAVDADGDTEIDADVYLNALYAVPGVVANIAPSSRGIVYTLNAMIGTAPAPLSLQLQQPPSPVIQQQVITAPGPFTWTPPANVTQVRVQKWGGGGGQGGMTAVGFGGGAHGGEYAENPGYPCTPGEMLNGYVGYGGALGTGGFVQRVAFGRLASVSATKFSGNVENPTTGGQSLIVQIGFGTTGGTVVSVHDTVGNTYVQDYAAPRSNTQQRCFEVWRCPTAAALGESDSITVTLSSAQSRGGAFICDEYSPLGNPDVTNYAYTSFGNSLNPSATMLSTDNVAVAGCYVTATQVDLSLAGPYHVGGPPEDGGDCEILAGYRDSITPGSQAAMFSWGGSQHSAVAVILGYPLVSTGSVNGQDTWFGADDTTAAHGGLGVAANTSAGATGQTGTSTDAIVFSGGNGATGTTTGGGGGESGGPTAAGHAGSDPTGGTGTANAGDGGAGGASGGNNPGTAGMGPGGGGGGAVSTGGTAAGGQGANGQVILSWTGSLVPFKTAIVHRPGYDAPTLLTPLVDVGDGMDVPDGNTVYEVESPVAGQNARFYGTYSVVLVNYAWNQATLNNSRSISVTVSQFEYPGGPSVSVSTSSVPFTPSNNTPGTSGYTDPNGILVLGEVTLPIRDLADDQTAAFYTLTVTDSDTGDRFMDVLFLDTQGQTMIVSISSTNGYCNYYIDAPDPNNDLGHLLGSTYDRSQAVGVLDSSIWSGGPIAVLPGINYLLTYAVEGQPNLIAMYAPCWWTERTT